MATAQAAPVTFCVATNGNDTWSGRLSAPNAAATDGPFATIERARDEIEKKARSYVRFPDNLLNTDPRFVDAKAGNFQLRDESPAWKLGFQRIPLEKIGLYPSDDRASWPVNHAVRSKPGPVNDPKSRSK